MRTALAFGSRVPGHDRGANVRFFFQTQKDVVNRFLGREVGRIDTDGGMLGRLAWIGDP